MESIKVFFYQCYIKAAIFIWAWNFLLSHCFSFTMEIPTRVDCSSVYNLTDFYTWDLNSCQMIQVKAALNRPMSCVKVERKKGRTIQLCQRLEQICIYTVSSRELIIFGCELKGLYGVQIECSDVNFNFRTNESETTRYATIARSIYVSYELFYIAMI